MPNDYSPENVRRMKKVFERDPTKNPFTKRTIQPDGAKYKELVKLFNNVDVIKTPTSPPKTTLKTPPKAQKTVKVDKKKNDVDINEMKRLFEQNPTKNPYNNRTIKLGGPKYKELVIEFGSDIKTPASSPDTTIKKTPKSPKATKPKTGEFSESECRLWMQNRLINPKTNRTLKLNGPIYKKLEAQCLNFDVQSLPDSPPRSQTSTDKKSSLNTLQLNGRTFLESSLKVSRIEKFQQMAESKGFLMTNVAGDGNCMLTSTGSYFNMSSEDLRKYLSDYMSRCELNSSFFTYDKEFIKDLKTNGKWCDERTINLMTTALNVQFIILNESTESIYEIGESTSPNKIFLGYLNDYHYVILTPMGQSQSIYTLPKSVTCEKTSPKQMPEFPPKRNPQPVRDPPKESVVVAPMTVKKHLQSPEEILKLVESIHNVKTATKISTFMKNETSLFKMIGII